MVDRYRTQNGERSGGLGAWRNTDPGSPIGGQGDGHWRYASVSETLGWKPSLHAFSGRTPLCRLKLSDGEHVRGVDENGLAFEDPTCASAHVIAGG